jgi:hypothetical protein
MSKKGVYEQVVQTVDSDRSRHADHFSPIYTYVYLLPLSRYLGLKFENPEFSIFSNLSFLVF